MYNHSNQADFKDNSQNRPKTNWLPWLLTAGMAILLILNYSGTKVGLSGRWLPSLLTLVCPLMMLIMMFGMGHHRTGSSHDQESAGHHSCCHGHGSKAENQ